LHTLIIIVHRDIKPENIMMCRNTGNDAPKFKLIDLGVCRRFKEGQRLSLTFEDVSILYSAPEKFTSINDTGYYLPIDIWALGISFSQLITYDCVLGRPSSPDALTQRLSQDAPARTLTDEETGIPGVAAIVNSMLQRNPDDRPTCSELLAKVRAVQDEQMKSFHAQMLRRISLVDLKYMQDLDTQCKQLCGYQSPLYSAFGGALLQAQEEKQQEQDLRETQAREALAASRTQKPGPERLTINHHSPSPARAQRATGSKWVHHAYGASAGVDMLNEVQSIVKGGTSPAGTVGSTVIIRASPDPNAGPDTRPDVLEAYTVGEGISPLVLPRDTVIHAVVVYKVGNVSSVGVRNNLLGHLRGVLGHVASTGSVVPPILAYGSARMAPTTAVRETCEIAWASVTESVVPTSIPSPSSPVSSAQQTKAPKRTPKKTCKTPVDRLPPAGSGALTGYLHLLGGHASPECLAGLDSLWTEGQPPVGTTLFISKGPRSLPAIVRASSAVLPSYIDKKDTATHLSELKRTVEGVAVQCVVLYKGPRCKDLKTKNYLKDILLAVYGSVSSADVPQIPVFLYDSNMQTGPQASPGPLRTIVQRVTETYAATPRETPAPAPLASEAAVTIASYTPASLPTSVTEHTTQTVETVETVEKVTTEPVSPETVDQL
ncbi:hypothetical protein KIPB_005063, partial [Kipferlia bialata]